MENNYIQHHGIKGQKWGVRRYQRKDGSLTPAGKKRYDDDGFMPTTRRPDPPKPMMRREPKLSKISQKYKEILDTASEWGRMDAINPRKPKPKPDINDRYTPDAVKKAYKYIKDANERRKEAQEIKNATGKDKAGKIAKKVAKDTLKALREGKTPRKMANEKVYDPKTERRRTNGKIAVATTLGVVGALAISAAGTIAVTGRIFKDLGIIPD